MDRTYVIWRAVRGTALPSDSSKIEWILNERTDVLEEQDLQVMQDHFQHTKEEYTLVQGEVHIVNEKETAFYYIDTFYLGGG